ncbi:MAG: methionine--tRNA ligase subunit beta [Nitrososphaerota archaeon]|jgi:methionine--tRNA ligase beta chain|nr:methionine--tRNA ligase subunit beta [Nitrososphaerota archaeon]MDG6927631.1 methionine--tRNA ligase subunit beta [Nitrososphaerota archaeon]MDG6931386.1 methionine--tRNA ligase subunit beta [Nitrososphaerota archaeon]MDG6931596.1 methionine--tRNA ligase subunit beta [Nitrososphaerota archaeon]MDG6935987.1 methionine--tRNA ligase subunit beta [Nitrososphaerota archaeon]
MSLVEFDAFQKLDLRVGNIKEVYPIEGSRKLLKVIIDLGDSQKQAIAGISKYYNAQDLVGKRVIVVTNLVPKPIMGYVSEVMLLAAFNEANLSLLTTDKDMPPGTKIS